MDELRAALDGDDVGQIKAKSDALTEASHKLAQAVYEKVQAQGAPTSGTTADGGGEDEVIEEAEYEVVDEEARST